MSLVFFKVQQIKYTKISLINSYYIYSAYLLNFHGNHFPWIPWLQSQIHSKSVPFGIFSISNIQTKFQLHYIMQEKL